MKRIEGVIAVGAPHVPRDELVTRRTEGFLTALFGVLAALMPVLATGLHALSNPVPLTSWRSFIRVHPAVATFVPYPDWFVFAGALLVLVLLSAGYVLLPAMGVTGRLCLAVLAFVFLASAVLMQVGRPIENGPVPHTLWWIVGPMLVVTAFRKLGHRPLPAGAGRRLRAFVVTFVWLIPLYMFGWYASLMVNWALWMRL